LTFFVSCGTGWQGVGGAEQPNPITLGAMHCAAGGQQAAGIFDRAVE